MAEQHLIVEDIDAMIQTGLVVRDASGGRIGTVRDYSASAAYLVVQTGPLAHKAFYVPYSAIRGIDPHEVYLTLGRGDVLRDYHTPPPATVLVEGATARTLVPAGYDGPPAEVNSVDLETVRRQLGRGMTVRARFDETIGAVDGIDEDAGFMLVNRNPFSMQDFVIPFSAIASIAEEMNEVHLAVSRDVVQKEFVQLSRDAGLHVDVLAVPGAAPAVGMAVDQDQRALERSVEEESFVDKETRNV